jgi:ribosome biogenesis GTPase / thiamine phosphate phosphatase
MSRQTDRLDEDDVRIRPGRTKSRPRTKDRPEHRDTTAGIVTAVDRGRFTCLVDDIQLYAVKARELGRKGIVVGDRVDLAGAVDADADNHARIVRRQPRVSELRRTADDDDPVERVIVANATRLGIVASTVNPDPNIGLIDRAVVAALDAGITPFLVITKSDLASPEPLEELARSIDMQTFQVDAKVPDTALITSLRGEETVLLGASGVGKSTLVNALVPDAHRLTGVVNIVTGKGRHTSTSARAFPLPGQGVLVDTPGIRSFGLAHVEPSRVLAAFPDLIADACPRGCSHLDESCEISGTPERLASMRRLLTSVTANP